MEARASSHTGRPRVIVVFPPRSLPPPPSSSRNPVSSEKRAKYNNNNDVDLKRHIYTYIYVLRYHLATIPACTTQRDVTYNIFHTVNISYVCSARGVNGSSEYCTSVNTNFNYNTVLCSVIRAP